jgi:transcriptional regulator with XRE-family HTH domain
VEHTHPRRCRRCDAVLRRRNQGELCDPCDRAPHATTFPAPPTLDLPPGFYARRDVVVALSRYDFATFFKAIRAEEGLSQEALGLLIGVDQSRICKIETGAQRLRDIATVARIARICAIPPGLLGFDQFAGGGPGNRQGVSWLERRDFLTVVAGLALGIPGTVMTGRLDDLVPAGEVEPLTHVGIADVTRIEAATAAFRTWDNQRGGGGSRAAVTGHLQWVVATARRASCASEDIRTRLLTATADLASLVAFMHYDVELHEDARRLWLIALDAAREAHNADLVSKVLREMAHQALHLDRPDEALRLLQVAATTSLATVANQVAPAALAELAAYEGWAHAMMGRVQQCRGALGRAEEAFNGARTDELPPWMSYFDIAELNALRGHCLHVLANERVEAAAEAEPLLRAAVKDRGAEYVRRKTLNQIALSATYFQRGVDIEEGIAVGQRALLGARSLSSPRALSRLRGLAKVTKRFHAEPPVAEFRQQVETVLARGAARA